MKTGILIGVLVAVVGFATFVNYRNIESRRPPEPAEQPAPTEEEITEGLADAAAGDSDEADSDETEGEENEGTEVASADEAELEMREEQGSIEPETGPDGGPPGMPGERTVVMAEKPTVVKPEMNARQPRRTDSMTSGGWFRDNSAENPETRVPAGTL